VWRKGWVMKISEVKQWEARVREEGSGGEWSHDRKTSFTGRLVCACPLPFAARSCSSLASLLRPLTHDHRAVGAQPQLQLLLSSLWLVSRDPLRPDAAAEAETDAAMRHGETAVRR